LKKFVVTANAPIMEERIFIEGEQYYAMAMAMTIQWNAMQCNAYRAAVELSHHPKFKKVDEHRFQNAHKITVWTVWTLESN